MGGAGLINFLLLKREDLIRGRGLRGFMVFTIL